YFPELGAFLIYLVMVLILMWRPAGLFGRRWVAAAHTISSPQHYLTSLVRGSAAEIAFWLATLLPFFLFPNYLSLASQIAITALFALSLDLILGYAGVVSLGHAAFFGIGAYSAGLFSKFVWGEPFSGLLVAAL